MGQWSRVGSLGRVYVIVVDTFEEKRRVVTIDNVDFTIYDVVSDSVHNAVPTC